MNLRIWYVSHYAVPREISVGWRSQYIAKALSKHGHDVTVFAASQHHWVYKPCGEIPFQESRDLDGYTFRTIAVPAYSGNGLGRMRNVMAFSRGMAEALVKAKKENLAPDIIIVSSPHPWVWPVLSREAGGKIKMIFEERDIWPLSLIELAGTSPRHPVVWWLNHIMKQVYKEAEVVISLLPESEAFLQKQGLRPGRFAYIPNGVDPVIFEKADMTKCPAEAEAAIQKAKHAGKLTVVYTGAMGPPNALENILQLGDLKMTERPYHFFLMGGGISRADLERVKLERRLDFITFLPQGKREEAWAVVKKGDVAYIGLKGMPLFEHGVSPNKLFDYCMLSKPVLWNIKAGNHPVSDVSAGLETVPGNPVSLDAALRQLAATSPEEREKMGKRGQEYILEHHNWEKLGRRYARICEGVYREEPLSALYRQTDIPKNRPENE